MLGFAVLFAITVSTGDSIKIRRMKEIENKIKKMQSDIDYYDFHQRLDSLERNTISFSRIDTNTEKDKFNKELKEIKRDAEEETERINKALYKMQMSIADEDKFNLVRKRYEESLRHKKAMEEINKED